MTATSEPTVAEFLSAIFEKGEAEAWASAVAKPLLRIADLHDPRFGDHFGPVATAFMSYVLGEREALQALSGNDFTRAPRGSDQGGMRGRLVYFADLYRCAS